MSSPPQPSPWNILPTPRLPNDNQTTKPTAHSFNYPLQPVPSTHIKDSTPTSPRSGPTYKPFTMSYATLRPPPDDQANKGSDPLPAHVPHHHPYSPKKLKPEMPMGSCISAPLPHCDRTSPNVPNPHSITHIVAHWAGNSSPPNHWLFEYRMNLGPVTLGQKVVLHRRAADCFNPDPALQPLMEGRLVEVTNCTPHWLTFRVVNGKGKSALLSVPNYRAVCQLLPNA